MATEAAAVDVAAVHEMDKETSPKDDASLKRKASPIDEDSTKRPRKDSTGDDNDYSRHDQPSPPSRRSSVQEPRNERRESASATQEEKKRGKRLFGGLLSTLSQTNTNSHHKRRQEIERRQQERIQKQRDEDDQKRAENLSRVREVRMAGQIGFEEQVMRNRHKKLLALAEFLKTRSQPAIYYLPWKRTADQEDIIDDQIREAKETIAKEEDEFKIKKERHVQRYGPRRQSDVSARSEQEQKQPAAPEKAETSSITEPAPPVEVKASHHHHHDPHDESGDVLVEADEDMVIY